jgi:hypothetical protein
MQLNLAEVSTLGKKQMLPPGDKATYETSRISAALHYWAGQARSLG